MVYIMGKKEKKKETTCFEKQNVHLMCNMNSYD